MVSGFLPLAGYRCIIQLPGLPEPALSVRGELPKSTRNVTVSLDDPTPDEHFARVIFVGAGTTTYPHPRVEGSQS